MDLADGPPCSPRTESAPYPASMESVAAPAMPGLDTAILPESMAEWPAGAGSPPDACAHHAPPAPSSVSGEPMRMDGTGARSLADSTSRLEGFESRSASLMVTAMLVPGAAGPPPCPMPTDAVDGPVTAETLRSLYSNEAAVPRGASRGTHTVDSPSPSWLTNSEDDARVSITVTSAVCAAPPAPPSASIEPPCCRPLGLNDTVRPASIVSAPLSAKPTARRCGCMSTAGCRPPPPPL